MTKRLLRFHFKSFFSILCIGLGMYSVCYAHDEVERLVWVNEALVATYTYDAQNFVARQKEIAHYFTSDGWIAFNKALTAAQIPQTIQKNLYQVSAVAISPPEVKLVRQDRWQATMPLLVVFKNPQYEQKQYLLMTMQFITAPAGQGVRGYAITALQSKTTKPNCNCPQP